MDPESDQELLNQALSDTPPADPPAPVDAPPEPPAEPPAPTEDRPRDEQGRFVPKTGTEPPAEPPAVAPAAAPPAEPPQHHVPIAVMHKERERAQRAEQRYEQEVTPLQRRLDYLERMLASQLPQQAQQPAQPAAPPPNVFEDPDGWFNHALTPIRQQYEGVIQQQNQRWEALSRSIAYKDHGKEKVDGAQASMAQSLQSGDPTARMEYQRIMQSPDPYGELMEWHQRTTTLQQVGADPQAWLMKQLEDPAFLAKALEAAKAKASAPAATGARPPTAVSLPPSLRTIPSGGAPPADDVDPNDDAALLSNALARPKRR